MSDSSAVTGEVWMTSGAPSGSVVQSIASTTAGAGVGTSDRAATTPRVSRMPMIPAASTPAPTTTSDCPT